MTHRNAPLTPQGRLRLVLRCRHRPIAHIAAEAGVSRQCLGKWVARYREHGEAGLHDRSSAPAQRPTQTPVAVVEQIAVMRKNKWSARRIVRELAAQDIPISVATVTRWLHKLGLARLDHLDVDGEPLRRPGTIKAWWPGHMIHIDVKKVGRIPDGGGWRLDGPNEINHRSGIRRRLGFDYIHVAVDDHSRLGFARALPDEKGPTCAAFLADAAAFFAEHGIAIREVMTDNALNYRRSRDFQDTLRILDAKHILTRPHSPWQNGKAERFNRTLQENWAYRHPYLSNADRTEALEPWLDDYNYARPHTACEGRPPISRVSPTC